MARKINIKTTDKTGFEQNTQMNSSADPKMLSGDKLEEVSSVESIGRYDDFAELKIPTERYSASDEKGYGIKYKSSVHLGGPQSDRVRPHQKEAAKLFLADLRGFGLLADCVGSGKTYEACVVISELAVRGRIENLLIIVPDQALLNKWRYVVENEFGFGKGNLQVIEKLDRIEEVRPVPGKKCKKPVGAYIMTYDAFTSSSKETIRNYLFDLIVVDEAHNLCKVTEDKMASMYYLSVMMQTKKENEKPFCLLLTATPHSGNLAQMFNLWYFIRCKGGIPECFKKDGNPSGKELEEYLKEKEYYTKIVCKGAATVAEYIEKAECEFLVGLKGVESEIRNRFFSPFSMEVTSGQRRKVIPFGAVDYDGFQALKDYQKKLRTRIFLSLPENRDIRNKAKDAVNQSYVSVVMRSIMVRRKNDLEVSRDAFSYFFLPIDKKMSTDKLEPERNRAVPLFMLDDASCSVEGSEDLFTDHGGFRKTLFDENPHFLENGGAGNCGFANFYAEAFGYAAERKSDFIRIRQVECSVRDEAQTVFDAKCAKFVELVRAIRADREKKNHRVIVFFDYRTEDNSALEDTKSTWKRLLAYLNAKAPDLAEGLIEGKAENIKEAIKSYDAKDDAILFAEDQTFTEGQDLQNGNVVINFEVPVDPLTVDQRIGRVYRMGQSDGVEVHSFATMSRLDGYCLAYFAAIGILSDTDGDATILSGCNSDSMKVLRCPACKDVSLIYESDYGELLPDCEICKREGVADCKMDPRVITDSDGNQSEWYVCHHDPSHRMPIPKGEGDLRCNCRGDDSPIREVIVVNEFVCEGNSRHRIKRAKDKGYDYVCMSAARNKMFRTQDENGNNIVGCSKLCAFRNCPYVKDGCKLRKKIDMISNEEEAKLICAACKKWDSCDCRIDNGNRPGDKSVLNSCHLCNRFSKASRGFTCGTHPYAINFGVDYKKGKCPKCQHNLLQVEANTFETFILGRYENDKSFCDNFKREMENTLNIKTIIKFDR